MSLRAYARHRGVSLRAVQKALKSGRISAREDGRLDADVADANWARNTAPRPQPPVDSQQASGSKPAKPAPPPRTSTITPRPVRRREPSEPPRLESGLEYSKARAVRESYLARLAKIDFEERTASWSAAMRSRSRRSTGSAQFRDGMLNIPDRLAAVLAAESRSEAGARIAHDRDSQSTHGVRRCQPLREIYAHAAARRRTARSAAHGLGVGGPVPNACRSGRRPSPGRGARTARRTCARSWTASRRRRRSRPSS